MSMSENGVPSGTPAIGSPGAGLVQGAVTTAANYIGQSLLMDKAQRQAKELWKLQADYLRPAHQRQLLEEAGMNPDLAYGNLSNITGNMPSVSAPHAPDLSSAVTGAQLAESQRHLNESQARNLEAQTGVVNQTLSEMMDTFNLRFQHLEKQFQLTGQQIENLKSDKVLVEQNTSKVLYEVDYLFALTRMTDAQRDINEYVGKYWRSRAGFADQLNKAELEDMLARAGLNRTQAQRVGLDIQAFWLNFDLFRRSTMSQISLNTRQGNLFYRMGKYHEAQADFLKQQIQWLPFQMINSINDPSKFQLDENGTIVTDDNGVPKFDEGFISTEKSLKIFNGIVSPLLQGFGTGVGTYFMFKGARGGRSFGAGNPVMPAMDSPSVTPAGKPWVNRPMTQQGQDLLTKYYRLDPTSKEAKVIFRELHNKKYYKD